MRSKQKPHESLEPTPLSSEVASTPQALFDDAVSDEAYAILEILDMYHGDLFTMPEINVRISGEKLGNKRGTNYRSHYLIYALNYFLQRAAQEKCPQPDVTTIPVSPWWINHHQKIEKLQRFEEGEEKPATKKIKEAIGTPTLRFIMRTFRIMDTLDSSRPRIHPDSFQKSLVRIGIELRRIQGKPTKPEKIHQEAADRLTKSEGLFRETSDETLCITNHKSFDEEVITPEKIHQNTCERKNFSKLIADFIKEQGGLQLPTDGPHIPKQVQEKYLAKHDANFIHRLKVYYDLCRSRIAFPHAGHELAENDDVQRLVDDFDPSAPFLAFYFPPWDKIFQDEVADEA